MIRIILADDHQMFRQGLESILTAHAEFKIVGNASTGNQVLALLRTTTADVVVLDIGMPEMDGVETAKEIVKSFPGVYILILSMHGEPSYISSLRDLGVHGYLLKEDSELELVKAIQEVSRGLEYFSSSVVKIRRNYDAQKKESQLPKFTIRETDVLNGLANGLEYQKIAGKMEVKMSTVSTYMKNIRAKTGLGDKAAIVKYAIDNGFGKMKGKGK